MTIKRKVMFIFGTRPEAIKFSPLILEFEKHSSKFETFVCLTGQHKAMLDQVINFFSITPNVNLNLMTTEQGLLSFTAKSLTAINEVIDEIKPDLVFVQGDTNTAFVGGLVAKHNGVKLAHLEAGLRSYNKQSPFPEEINRLMLGDLADLHFAPTELGKENLQKEGITQSVYVVGNTVIDALLLAKKLLADKDESEYLNAFCFLDFSKKIILVTSHRRESFGEPLENICNSLLELAAVFPEIQILFPIHPNPMVTRTVKKILDSSVNIFLVEPLDYISLVWIMDKSYMIMTDSGGIQEEAPSLGKPVIVLRDITERQEGVNCGTSLIAGTNKEKIFKCASDLLCDETLYTKMSKSINPYGNGTSCKQIVEITDRILSIK